MNILVTGSNGFVGKNLVASLKNIRDGLDRTHNVMIDEIYEYDIDSSLDSLKEYCSKADFVFHLAGVNRPKDVSEFMIGNYGFSSTLLSTLKECHNTCPIMVSSSIQASLTGRFKDSEYGRSKLEGEKLFQSYQEQTGASVYIYRFSNLFGKWCKPNYNSAVATFCFNISHNLPIQVNDPNTVLDLIYIDDVIEELIGLLEGKGKRDSYPYYSVSLQVLVDKLYSFKSVQNNNFVLDCFDDVFTKKLYSTYLSYVDVSDMSYSLKMNKDSRGSFTELFKTASCGQFSVNISKPGITKGEHWHHSKWEVFVVVSGKGLIQQRKIGSNEVINFYVSGEHIQAVYMIPGYTHNIINLSDTDDLVTIMWANENFDVNHPDTYYEKVED
ncbi:MAG: NAD-dependent epimerase/dehydratase family protein [Erysipelotrichaceae bacterium]|uniref:polysaccharide biosynthesis C-terminal domain-containing protein n=1 Tax=Floccifex sp. TaxID=2815810 RepID=UPI002A74E884|nr:NAD-dependent epimerase/dehydratase family protein [Floccifex sp.]MDD7281491.1 NAD-dependent epimerase/dehydratase family protein [Erysipelotrichaceae bacterium]MDY2957689.1 NAD-dependent epimerase/dehydratase family protein [Floccifex sp.]